MKSTYREDIKNLKVSKHPTQRYSSERASWIFLMSTTKILESYQIWDSGRFRLQPYHPRPNCKQLTENTERATLIPKSLGISLSAFTIPLGNLVRCPHIASGVSGLIEHKTCQLELSSLANSLNAHRISH